MPGRGRGKILGLVDCQSATPGEVPVVTPLPLATPIGRGRGRPINNDVWFPPPPPLPVDTIDATPLTSNCALPAGAESDEDYYQEPIYPREEGEEPHSSDEEHISEDDDEIEFLVAASLHLATVTQQPAQPDPYSIKEERMEAKVFLREYLKELQKDSSDMLRSVFRIGARVFDSMEEELERRLAQQGDEGAKSAKKLNHNSLVEWLMKNWRADPALSQHRTVYLVALYCLNRVGWSTSSNANKNESHERRAFLSKCIILALNQWWSDEKKPRMEFPLAMQRLALAHALRDWVTQDQQEIFFSIFMHPEQSHPEEYVLDVLRLTHHGVLAKAVRVAKLTGAREFVPSDRIMLPLIAYRMDAPIQELIHGNTSLQRKFIQLVDQCHAIGGKYLQKNLEEMNLAIPVDGVPTSKALRKMAARYSQLYHVSHEESQHIKQQEEEKCIRYYLHRWASAQDKQERVAMQHYLIDHTISSNYLQGVVLRFLDSNGHTAAMHEWQEKYKKQSVERENKARRSREEMEEQQRREMEAELKTIAQSNEAFTTALIEWSGHGIYFIPSCPFHANSIVFVDTTVGFEEALAYLQSFDYIGIDTESHRNLATSQDTLSLLQLAGPDRVFLFDLIQLIDLCHESLWYELRDVFSHPNIMKLGYGLIDDLNELVNCIPHLRPMTSTPSSDEQVDDCDMGDYFPCVDLALIDKSDMLNSTFPPPAPAPPPSVPPGEGSDDSSPVLRGLSGMCLRVLGKPLRKAETISDWSARPLRMSQTIYAALDALCPVEICSKLLEQGIEVKANVKVDANPKVGRFKKPRYFK